ncbi:hypothetical protein [Sphingobacterium psychroaquaticum]|uniref:DUF4148 domain-containing protein n=1 Tax=Sphingobacterium psychroaquaticum TaxID=561061 RepID=A0A1X7I9N8_9SPHI|nr:hypothetical protein [Sphingobacterium psychroaquaticum]SMG11325.1 hypothetical protein SAMN05660862_0602 [Sphingobacterium psychroaquaticum]
MKKIKIGLLVLFLVGVAAHGQAQAQSEQARWEQIVTSGGKNKLPFKQESAAPKQAFSTPQGTIKNTGTGKVNPAESKGSASDLVSSRAVLENAAKKAPSPAVAPKISDQGVEPKK